MMRKLISSSRYIVIVPVIACLAATTVLMVYGAIQTGIEIFGMIKAVLGHHGDEGAHHHIEQASIAFIEIVDVFLLATVLYIIGVGLYELFIGPLDLPDWLEINDLDDLKVKLIGVLVTVLGVLFLGRVVRWDGTQSILPLGIAIALMIGAMTFFLAFQKKKGNGKVDADAE
jgi:uncharacterized membrane protein YqhA